MEETSPHWRVSLNNLPALMGGKGKKLSIAAFFSKVFSPFSDNEIEEQLW
jgi:hypothetical protein